MLRTALGPAIARFLEDPSIVEVMLNPDGRLWIDRVSSGLTDTGEGLSARDGERIKAHLPAGLSRAVKLFARRSVTQTCSDKLTIRSSRPP